MPDNPRPRTSLRLLGFYAVAVLLVLDLTRMTLLSNGTAVDLAIVQTSVHRMLRGQPLYNTDRMQGDFFGHNSHLPPFGLLLAVPFALLDWRSGQQAWRVLSLVAHFGSLALLLRTFGIARTSLLAPAALAVWAAFGPARSSFLLGQWDAFFLLALAAAWWAERHRRGALAGALLALAGSIKLYPLLALGYFATRRRWTAVLAAGFVLALAFGLAYLLAGPRESQTYLQQVLPLLGATTAYPENQSMAGFAARLVEPTMWTSVTQSAAVYGVSRGLLVGLLLPLGLLLLRAPRAALGADLQYAAWVAAAPIGLPVAWEHYQELLLLPFLVLAAAWCRPDRSGQPGRWDRLLYCLALALVASGDFHTVLGPAADDLWKADPGRAQAAGDYLLARFAGPAVLLLSLKLYGALLLWGLCLRAAWRASAWAGRPASWRALLAPQRA
jgi:hypothetical protein